jgi:hypothetical protein
MVRSNDDQLFHSLSDHCDERLCYIYAELLSTIFTFSIFRVSTGFIRSVVVLTCIEARSLCSRDRMKTGEAKIHRFSLFAGKAH